MNRIAIALLLLCFARTIYAISFDLPPGREECFFEDVHQGTTINGAFAVTQGSHMDIDVRIYAPDDTQIYNAKREGEDKFMLKADRDGTYRFCFSNKVRCHKHWQFTCARPFLTSREELKLPYTKADTLQASAYTLQTQ